MSEEIKNINDEIRKLEKLKMDILSQTKGGNKMKIGISATGKGIDSHVDARFGRCPNFVIVELDGKEIKGVEDVENTANAQMGGAGISAAQIVADRGVKAVITGNMGPRAFQVFSQLGIDVYQGEGTIKEAVEKFSNGELQKVSGPTGPMGVGVPGGSRGGPQQ